ncbi:ABC transporter substrate-binding protein/permease [Sandaracinus amylolyticus]|uniref:ABC transporter substrate-binding protein/permease n=1 Tax=Sandaracinus amylolyticus TaxID=927083 RepID=UPI001F241DF3|nr:ABC transporter substrate-binding protein/permease [Sandaracinus amylolyticus]UJR81689.1 ABC-type amino acid transport system permease component [Sandaracinus amylolyticus]
MRRSPAFLGLALIAALLASCDEPSESGLERVRRTGVLRWGGDVQGGEPYVFEDPARPGTLIGFEVELADAIAREMGVRAQFVQNDWSNLVPSLERGSFDVAMNGLEVTPSRADSVLFTRPYFVFAAQLVARAEDTSVTDLESLRGRRVGTLASSFSWDMLNAAGVEVVAYEGVEEPYADLEGGRLDAVLLDDIIASRYGLVRPSLRLVEDSGEGFYAVAARQGEGDLRDAIDQAIARLAASGELRRILSRWEIDHERQGRLATWTEDDTRAMLRVHGHAHFSLHHVWLFLQGAIVTLLVSASAMVLAIGLGLLLALARMYGPRGLAVPATFYVELFRGTPVLLQLYLLYFGIMPSVRHALGWHAGIESDALVAAVVGLGLNYAAYEAEIYRAGIQAIPPGQMEAAKVLGMGTMLALRRVVVPQAFRIALPGVTNDFIALLKDSSLVSVITVVELTKRMTITAIDVRSWLLPGLLCAAFYMAMSYPLSRLSQHLEQKLARQESR